MLFFLKKFITFWLLPLPVCLVLLGLGLFHLCRPRQKPVLGRLLVFLSLLLLLCFSNKDFSRRLIVRLETLHPACVLPSPGLQHCRAIVILGGGHGGAPGLPALSQLSDSALGRLAEGLRLARALPEAELIVSGPSPVDGTPSHGQRLAEAAQSLGFDRSRIRIIDQARDTEDEAAEVSRLVGDAPIALVTSAWHMPRAAALFRAAGINTLPCPADFRGKPPVGFSLGNYSFDTESLTRSTMALHEYLGLLWLRLRGKI